MPYRVKIIKQKKRMSREIYKDTYNTKWKPSWAHHLNCNIYRRQKKSVFFGFPPHIFFFIDSFRRSLENGKMILEESLKRLKDK